MPELPDVAVFKQYLDATALHKKIDDVEIHSRETLKGISARKLKTTLKGKSLVSTHRHGKYLFTETTGDKWLVLHFGMTGFLKYFKDPTKEPPHNRLLLRFSNGFHLVYDCQRRLGEITFTGDPDSFVKENQLGPDALDTDFDLDRFRETIEGTNATIKSALMNQKHMAGIGNVYSDEILFQAGIHPGAKSGRLDESGIKRLYSKKEHVLKAAIEARADPRQFPSSFMTPHRGEEDGICPKCETAIEKVKNRNPRLSFPTMFIGEKVIVGFKEEEIKEALSLQRS